MPTIHDEITDPDIHEPKGVVTASANEVYIADGEGSGAWVSLPSGDPVTLAAPIGTISSYGGTTAPSKWTLCYGQAISRTTYSALFAKIGTTYGAGNGSTTFNLPDCRGRVSAGKDNMGGTSANRLTNQTGGLNGDILGASGGQEAVTLTAAQIPQLTGSAASAGSHTHGITNGTSAVRDGSLTLASPTTNGNDIFDTNITVTLVAAGTHSHTVTVNSGGGDPHSNIQPTLIINKIIYHGVA